MVQDVSTCDRLGGKMSSCCQVDWGDLWALRLSPSLSLGHHQRLLVLSQEFKDGGDSG